MTGHDEGTAPASLRCTLALIRPVSGRLVATTLLGAGTVASGVALLATSAWLITRASQRPTVVTLGVAIVGVRFFALTRGLLRYAERLTGHDGALRLLARLRVRLYSRLERLAPEGLPHFGRGDLLDRLVQDVDTMQELMLRVVPPLGVAVIVGLASIGVVWIIWPRAGAVLALSLGLAATLVPWTTQRATRRQERRQADVRGELNRRIVGLVEAAPELVAFGAVDSERLAITGCDEELTRIARAAAHNTGTGLALTTWLTGLAVWGMLVVGVPGFHAGNLSGPLLAVVVLLPLAAFELVGPLPAAARQLEHARLAAGRLLAVFDAPASRNEHRATVSPPRSPYRFELHNVGARHGSGPLALVGLDLDLPAGRRVGIVGASGAGKSTLAAVLLGFLQPATGSITVNGVVLDEIAEEDLRHIVGLTTANAHVFNAPLRENLLLARRDATDPELWGALDRVHLTEWAASLPEGLDTLLGEGGFGLSGGQRQRVGIARALLADFPVLVLDEPAEHLDSGTADALLVDLLAVTQDRTTVTISHRLAGLESLDEILLLDRGRVVERGRHDELLAAEGRYAARWRAERDTEPMGAYAT